MATTLSDGLPRLQPLLRIRAERSLPPGDRGRALCASLTACVDATIAGLVEASADARKVAAVALGGYGRAELGPRSDIDLMLLKPRGVSDAAVKAVLYPLWDAGLTVGHSVRTIDEALAAAEQRLENVAALMDARFLGGERKLFDEFLKRFNRWLPGRATPILRELRARELQRRAVEPHPLLEPDLKEGRGSLRVAQALRWAARLGRAGETQHLDPAYDELLAARNAIHVAAGKGETVLRAHLWDATAPGDATDWPGPVLRALRRIDAAAAHAWGIESGAPAGDATLRDLLETPDALRQHIESLALEGRADAVVAGLQQAFGRPQQPEFHRHPLDVHLVRAVEEVHAVASEEGPEPYAVGVAARLPTLRPALAAAFMHDLGKVDGNPHESLGARRVEASRDRLGLGDRELRIVATVVAEHLLLPRIATTRDVNDEDVIRSVVARVGDTETLDTLYLVSVADGRASGPGAWNGWKAELVRNLHERAFRWLTDRSPAPPAAIPDRSGMSHSYRQAFDEAARARHAALMAPNPGAAEVRLEASAGDQDEAIVVARDRQGLLSVVAGAFTASGIGILSAQVFTRDDGVALEVLRTQGSVGGSVPPGAYERARGLISAELAAPGGLAPQVARKLHDYRPLHALSWTAPHVTVSNAASARYTVLEVRAPDRLGLLYTITTELAACGLDVHLARVTTQGDAALDTFYVSDATGARVADERRLAEIEARVWDAVARLLAG